MPHVSLIIPVRNLAALTMRCASALLSQPPASATVEIIVVDDASTDGTCEVLASFGDRIQVISRVENAGFATACNDGARAARGEYLVFLNNDTRAEAGWLDALVEHAERHPEAAVVGSKLLFANLTIQHAGIVIGQDRVPRHVYAGFPSDHPAVNKSRVFQAVTGACMLVRRAVFEAVSGFDSGFRNGLEDVDLCLRLRERGHEVHYCHSSVLYHLESVSAGRFDSMNGNWRRFQERWGHRLVADDLQYYVEDGLLTVEYGRSYPLALEVSPSLAVIEHDEREGQTSRLLVGRARQVLDLLKENARLSVDLGEAELRLRRSSESVDAEFGDLRRTAVAHEDQIRSLAARVDIAAGSDASMRAVLFELHDQLLRRDDEIQSCIHDLQADLGLLLKTAGTGPSANAPKPLQYQALVRELRELVCRVVPSGATVLVASKGDSELLKFEDRTGWHFPRTERGGYAGHYPADSADAIAQLEQVRAKGGQFLVFPQTALWWLDHYKAFREHLEARDEVVARDDLAVIFRLRNELSSQIVAAQTAPTGTQEPLARQIREVVRSVLPPTATVLVLTEGTHEFLDLEGRRAASFPAPFDGQAGGDAPSGDALISQLEALKDEGFEFLLIPRPAMTWLQAQTVLMNYLDRSLRTIVRQQHVCWLVALSGRSEPRENVALQLSTPVEMGS